MTPEQRTELIKAAFLDELIDIVASKAEMTKEARAAAGEGLWAGIKSLFGSPATRAATGLNPSRFLMPALGAYGMGAVGSGSLNPLEVAPWMVQHPFMTAGGALGAGALGGLGRGVAGMMPGAGRSYPQLLSQFTDEAVARGIPRPQAIAQAEQSIQAMLNSQGGQAFARQMASAGRSRPMLGAAIALPALGLGGMHLLGQGKEMIMGPSGGGGGGGIFGGGGSGGLGFVPNLALSGLGGYGGWQAGEAMGLPWWGKAGLGALGATVTPQLVGSMVGGPGGGAMPAGYGY